MLIGRKANVHLTDLTGELENLGDDSLDGEGVYSGVFTEGWIRVSKGFEGGVYKSFLAKKVREMVNLHKSWVALGLNSSTVDTSNRFS